ncbi:hypothetical protein OK349_10785 [Sphingomonas sp. BT-65]|uniref:hypothetical protein n=1 Tax=Sphingomonas sp. BT-65 TaxID=2989821 RepID=UPI002236BA00|nr:hypothetical protein [Sphingomonas sp. BT-65]MCW4462192.1 hypothetical protein [Sphingomonas sp. BT-65]
MGGPKDTVNTGYITPEAAEARALLIGTLERFTDKGLIDKMAVEPNYRGTSIIPTRLHFKAWHSMRDSPPFEGVWRFGREAMRSSISRRFPREIAREA